MRTSTLSHVLNLALTVLCVPYSLGSGSQMRGDHEPKVIERIVKSESTDGIRQAWSRAWRHRGGACWQAILGKSNGGVVDSPDANALLRAAAMLPPLHPISYTLHPSPYTLYSTPYTLHPTPYTLHPKTFTLHPTPNTLYPTPHTHPTPFTLHPTPFTLHPTPYTLHPTPYTLHPTPYTLHPTPPLPLPSEEGTT